MRPLGGDSVVLVVSERQLFLDLLVGALRQRTPGLRIETGTQAKRTAVHARDRHWDAVVVETGLVEEIATGPSLAIRDLAVAWRVLVITAVPDPVHIGMLLHAGAHGVLTMRDGLSTVARAVDATISGRRVHEDAEVAAYGAAARTRIREDAERQRRLDSLTTSEQQVLDLLRRGLTAGEIAADRHVALTTVRGHIRAVLCKLGVNSQLGAVVYASGHIDHD